jgi:mono/diheme cytochrome c family protein
MRSLLILLAVFLLLVIAAAAFVWSGAYNVAATSPELPVVEWWLETVAERSIAAHARSVVPPTLSEQDLEAGFRHYHSLCVACHGAPGMPVPAIGQGLNPAAPSLELTEVQEWSDSELFWVIKNGIRMSGMPAFGVTHNDEELWAVVAFVRRLRTLSAEGYQALLESSTAAVAPPSAEPDDTPPQGTADGS